MPSAAERRTTGLAQAAALLALGACLGAGRVSLPARHAGAGTQTRPGQLGCGHRSRDARTGEGAVRFPWSRGRRRSCHGDVARTDRPHLRRGRGRLVGGHGDASLARPDVLGCWLVGRGIGGARPRAARRRRRSHAHHGCTCAGTPGARVESALRNRYRPTLPHPSLPDLPFVGELRRIEGGGWHGAAPSRTGRGPA